jgi:putative membrane protein
MMFPGMGGWMMAASGILLLLIVGVAVVTVLLRPGRAAGPGISRPSAKELLDQRYARGEIDDDEYYRRLSVLDSTEAENTGRRLGPTT